MLCSGCELQEDPTTKGCMKPPMHTWKEMHLLDLQHRHLRALCTCHSRGTILSPPAHGHPVRPGAARVPASPPELHREQVGRDTVAGLLLQHMVTTISYKSSPRQGMVSSIPAQAPSWQAAPQTPPESSPGHRSPLSSWPGVRITCL